MRRKDYTRIIVYLILLLLYNIVFFMTKGIDLSVTVWIAYGCTQVGILLSCVTPFFCIRYKRVPENLVTIYILAWLYTILTILVNTLFVMEVLNEQKLCIIFNLILLGLFVIAVIINLNINHEVETNIETLDAEREFIGRTSKKLKMLMLLSQDIEQRKKIEKMYDLVRTSPLHSSTEVIDYEIDVMRLVDEMEEKSNQNQVLNMDFYVSEITRNIAKRNTLLQ